MTSRERVINTLFFQSYRPVPRLLSISNEVEKACADTCRELRRRIPNDIDWISFPRTPLDAWGCMWSETETGWVPADTPVLASVGELQGIRIPKAGFSADYLDIVNAACENNPRFVVAESGINPFQRLLGLVGEEGTAFLLKRTPRFFVEFLKHVHPYYMAWLQAVCSTDADAVSIGEEWAWPHALRLDAGRWNEFFAPMYRDYCEIIRKADKFVYFSADGNYEEIVPHLIHCGVDVLRFREKAMKVGTMTERYGKRVALHAILDAEILEQESETEISNRVYAIRRNLENVGGLIAECRIPKDAIPRKVAYSMSAWERSLPRESEFSTR